MTKTITEPQQRTISDLADFMKHNRETKVCVLIGAGCSISADIPSANSIIDDIRENRPTVYKRAIENFKARADAENKIIPTDKPITPTYADIMGALGETKVEFVRQLMSKSKVNWAHLGLAQLMKAGYIDRVLTTNFDNLVSRACSMVGQYPPAYDMVSIGRDFNPDKVPDQSIFHLHGQQAGFVQLHEADKFQKHKTRLEPVFSEAGAKRRWVVVGYSGENDPVFQHLAKIKEFSNGLYWVSFKDELGDEVKEQVLTTSTHAYEVNTQHGADEFFCWPLT